MQWSKKVRRLFLSIPLAIPVGALVSAIWDYLFNVEPLHPLWALPFMFFESVLYRMLVFLLSLIITSNTEGELPREWVMIGFAISLFCLIVPWRRLKVPALRIRSDRPG